MKKLFAAILILCLIVPAACFGEGYDPVKEFGSNVLNVYNWGEYIDKQVITNFEKEYKVRVNYDVYDSNETMYTKLMSGAARINPPKESFKMATSVVTMGPIILLYPFVQKYFVAGLTVGSGKG